MEISKKMNLVIPVETENGKIYVHSTPISKEVYKENFFIMSKVFAEIFSQGLGVIAGPRIAYMMLEKLAKDANAWEGDRGVKNSLVREIIKNTHAIIPIAGKGWDDMPLDVAIERKLLDPDDVLGEVVFFICICAINKPAQASQMMTEMNTVWNSASTSLNSMEWAKSLPTSTPEDNTGETQTTSSVPS